MANYVVEDEINDYVTPYKTSSSNHINKFIIITIAFIIMLVLIVIIVTKFSGSNNSYSSYEKEMVNKSREYVTNSGISTDKEIYLDVSKLNIKLPNNCSLLSGVIYDGNNYEPYLICSDYKSQITGNNYDSEISEENFKLVGNEVMFLLKGMEYYELGYTGNQEVSISGSNGISDAGVYSVYYVANGSRYSLTRKVIVLDNPELASYFPVINTNGQETITLTKGDNYDENVTAVDSIDGNLTDKIIKVSNLDTSVVGEYKIIYSVSNSLGYTNTTMKKILVVDSNEEELNIITTLSNEDITNESIIVKINVIGNDYSYTKLPDGTTVSEKEFEYEIQENGEYEFIAVDVNGGETNKVLNITTIDKTIPNGSCTAVMYNDKTSITVSISTFNYVVSYNYHTDNVSSGYITSNYYNSNKANPFSVYVTVKDYVGNEGKIICTKSDKQSYFDPQGIRMVIRNKPRLRIPIATALANKGHTVNDLNKCIYDRVKEAGPYTRYGVAAAAFGLIECTYNMTGYVLSYNHVGGRVDGNYCQTNSDICGKLGINTIWGKPGGVCAKDECWQGLNCATFVRWSMCNGGMDLCSKGSSDALGSNGMAGTKYFPEADAVQIKGKSVSYYAGNNLTNNSADTLVRMLRPGDVIGSEWTDGSNGHVFMVVGYDENGIYTAEDGYYMRYVHYSELTNGNKIYILLFLDKYYANTANRNSLYN